MSELRQNLANMEWVIMAPERLKGKPFQVEQNPLRDTVPNYSDKCPFCPRNEDRYENVEIDHIEHPDPENSSQSPWLVRCIENKYKIFEEFESCPVEPTEFEREGIYSRFMGCGSHELIIESPEHNATLATMTQAEVEAVSELYVRRFSMIGQNPNNLLCMIFKNHGPRSGASQVHPHSQILGMRVVPIYLRFLLEEAQRFFDSNGVCVFCKMLKFELEQDKRVIYQNERFVAYVPYAASVPFETHIFPKDHNLGFRDMQAPDISDFSDCLRQTMGMIYRTLSNPDYNLIFRNPPYHMSRVPFFHWHLQIFPHTKTQGGFEAGSRGAPGWRSSKRSAANLRSPWTGPCRR